MTPRFRIQEWLAQHVDQAQYPVLPKARPVRKLAWKYAMPWETRALMAFLGLLTILITLPVLLVMLYLAYLFMTNL